MPSNLRRAYRLIAAIALVVLSTAKANAYQGQADDNSKEGGQGKAPPQSAAPPNFVLSSAPSQPRAKAKQEDASDLWPKLEDRLCDPVTWFTGLLVLVGWRQWRAMREGLGATKTAADAAMISANMAKVSLEVAERADLLVEKVEVLNTSHSKTTAIVKVTIKNSGRTRAEGVIASCHLSISELNEDIAPCHAIKRPSVVAAGASFEVEFEPFSKWLNRRGANDAEAILGTISSGVGALRLCVEISYRDVFEGTRNHQTRGEAVYRPNTGGRWGEFPMDHVFAD